MTGVTMIDLCRATLPKVYFDAADIVEIERLRSAGYLIADAAAMSRETRKAAGLRSITVHSITPEGRALLRSYPPGFRPE